MMHDFSHFFSTAIERDLYLFLGLFILLVGLLTFLSDRYLGRPGRTENLGFKIDLKVIGLLIAIAVSSAFVILSHADMTFQDSVVLFPTEVAGQKQYYPPPIWPKEGRFFPLGIQEFEYLGLISKTLTCYNIYVAIQFALTLWIAALILNAGWFVVFCLTLCLVTSSAVSQTLLWPLYQERNITFLFLLLIWNAQAYLATGKRWALAGAVVCGSLLLFFKEIAFLLIGSVSVIGLVQFLRNRKEIHARRALVIGVGLAVAAGLWLLVYALAIAPQIEVSYHAARNQDFTSVDRALDYLKEAWVYILFAALILRATLLKKMPLNLLFDGLPLAAFLYLVAIVKFRFEDPYYTATSVWLTYLYAAYVLKKIDRKWLSLCGVLFCLAVQIPRGLPFAASQKEIMAAKSQAIAYLGKLEPGRTLRVHSFGLNQYQASLVMGLLQLRHERQMIFSVDGQKNWTESRPCGSALDLICYANMPVEPGDFLISFGKALLDPNLRLIFTSEPIGFWKNLYQVYIYQVPEATGGKDED